MEVSPEWRYPLNGGVPKARFHCKIISLLYRLTPDDIKEDVIIPLKFVKFQNVQSLTVSFKYPVDVIVKSDFQLSVIKPTAKQF